MIYFDDSKESNGYNKMAAALERRNTKDEGDLKLQSV